MNHPNRSRRTIRAGTELWTVIFRLNDYLRAEGVYSTQTKAIEACIEGIFRFLTLSIVLSFDATVSKKAASLARRVKHMDLISYKLEGGALITIDLVNMKTKKVEQERILTITRERLDERPGSFSLDADGVLEPPASNPRDILEPPPGHLN